MNEKKQAVMNAMIAFSEVSKVPVAYYDASFNMEWVHPKGSRFCNIFGDNKDFRYKCTDNLKNAATTAATIKEPYIFMCNSGMVEIAFPLMAEGNTMYGCFFAGPIAMGANKRSMIKNMMNNFKNGINYLSDIISFCDTVDIKTPQEVSYIYNVFCSCTFQYNTPGIGFGPNDESIKDMVDAIILGDMEAGINSFQGFYEKTYITCSGKLNEIKVIMYKTINVIINALPPEIYISTSYLTKMEDLYNCYSFDEIYNIFMEILTELTEKSLETKYSGVSHVIQKVLNIIEVSYETNITLATVADSIHISPSYLSTLFKKETGKTFSKYLTQKRLDSSLSLLDETHLSVTEIALLCGFSNQSYFIKKFREAYGKTPIAYRNKKLDDN